MSDITQKLAAVALFKDLQAPELARIASIVRSASHKKGDKIFAEGDVGTCLYVVDSGRVRISKVIPGIGEEALAVLDPGSVFGEMSLLDDAPRSAHAIAHETCQLLAIDREQFDSMLFVDKELAYHVLSAITRQLAARLRETNDKIASFFAMTKFG